MTWRNLLLTKEKDQLHLGENLVAETGEMIEGIENGLDQGHDHARIDVVKRREDIVNNAEEKNVKENENVKKNEDENVEEEKRRKGRTFLDKKKERKHPKIRTDLVDQIVVMAVA